MAGPCPLGGPTSPLPYLNVVQSGKRKPGVRRPPTRLSSRRPRLNTPVMTPGAILVFLAFVVALGVLNKIEFGRFD